MVPLTKVNEADEEELLSYPENDPWDRLIKSDSKVSTNGLLLVTLETLI